MNVNECDGRNPCLSNTTCEDTDGSYNCKCKLGFTGNGTYCKDINECENKTTCNENAVCQNSLGSYTCMCKQGYTGNGQTCVDVGKSSQLNYFVASVNNYTVRPISVPGLNKNKSGNV